MSVARGPKRLKVPGPKRGPAAPFEITAPPIAVVFEISVLPSVPPLSPRVIRVPGTFSSKLVTLLRNICFVRRDPP